MASQTHLLQLSSEEKLSHNIMLLSSAFTSIVSSAIRLQHHQSSAIAATPSSLDCKQPLTTCDIVWRLPQGHMSVAARPHFFQQEAQWPWLIWKRFRSA